MKAKFISEREFEKDFKISNGKIITLKISDDFENITFWENGKNLGEQFEFVETESINDTYLLARMFCPIKYEGLGREAVIMFKEYTDAQIITRPPNSGKYNDGSELTGDAPGFVFKMQEEGLIEEWDL